MREHATSSTSLHLGPEGTVNGEANVVIAAHRGPYAVVNLRFGGFDLTIFPETRIGEMVAALRKAAAELETVAEKLNPTAVAVTD